MAEEKIKIIVGLGNPGKDYQFTRHNVGFWLVDQLVKPTIFSSENKFSGDCVKISMSSNPVWILKPQQFMNRSGLAIKQLSNFYKIEVENILVVHDDLDLQPGTAKIKKGGGHGGHNGLRDTINQLQSKDFYRLRLGIGHPGDKKQVTNFVLGTPSKIDRQLIEQAIDNSLNIMNLLVDGKFDLAMNQLHTK